MNDQTEITIMDKLMHKLTPELRSPKAASQLKITTDPKYERKSHMRHHIYRHSNNDVRRNETIVVIRKEDRRRDRSTIKQG
jgi:hypothetical protein